jgi:hypothetical protein
MMPHSKDVRMVCMWRLASCLTVDCRQGAAAQAATEVVLLCECAANFLASSEPAKVLPNTATTCNPVLTGTV